ncbi:facilitated trehalose transporter Tret1-like isoform X2 [Bacillus rossius redtenbacheri]
MSDARQQKELNLLIAGPEPSLGGEPKPSAPPPPPPPPLEAVAEPAAAAAPKKLLSWNLMPQILAALSVSFGSMIVGFVSGYTSPALASMANSTTNPFPLDRQEVSWVGSLMPLSALFGGMAGGPLIELVGRKATIVGTAIPFVIAHLLIAFANKVGMLYAARSISGFCVGIASLCLPVYLGETLQPEVRGTLGLLPTTLGNIGILLSFIAGSYLDWSQLAILGSFLPVPFFICMFLIPETPRWLISKGNHERAQKSLQWLRGKDSDIGPEFSAIEDTHNASLKTETTIWDLFKKPNLKPLAISIGLMFFQQLSGINAVIFYTASIFKMSGSTINENLATIIVGLVNFGSVFVATILIDRLGRKVLLYISATAMTISLIILGTFFSFKSAEYCVEAYGWIPLVSFVIYVVGFSLGYGPIPWLMMGEILPAKIRGSAASLTTGFNWACTFVVTKTFLDILNILGMGGTFFLFACICFTSIFFVFFLVPETQGKSLEDIEKNMTRAGRTVRRMSSIANLRPSPMAV